jgi:hypothetical protein
MRILPVSIAALAAASVTALTIPAASAAAAPGGDASAVTFFSGVPDSGYNGNWATDAFADFTGVTGDPALKCPEDARYGYAGTDRDYGTSQTIIGADSPGAASVPITRSVSVRMTGGFTGLTFCASSSTPSGVRVPFLAGSVQAANLGSQAWYAQFFRPGTTIANFSDAGWSWTYTLAEGPCGGPGFQRWTDALTVPEADSGNILAETCKG